MAIDFAGTELEAFIPSDANTVENSGNSGFNSSVVRCSIRVGNGAIAHYVETPVTTSRTECWTHWDWWVGSSTSNSGSTLITLFNSSGTAVFRLQFTGSLSLQAQYWNGSAWTNIGSTYSISITTRYTFDLKLICGASGSFALYVNGTGSPVMSGSASMTAVDNIAKRRWNACTSANGASNNFTHLSQVIVSDVSTLGHLYYSKPPTANGANTSWTSDYTAVDEVVLSTADFIESTVAGDVETFTGAAISIPTGVVKAVVVSTQSKNAASGPQNIQGCIRKGGTNYYSSNISGIGISYTPIQAIFETDPSTSTAWTLADAGAASLEFGVRSQA